ncbi:sodium:solute symporter [Haladaptatus pallidirubidus]|uniref:sodium:solute symporter family protein n=1 Tax=Haladaptatus pallidirubidus TaxID=1008152 RepID=UPI001D114DE5|nr:sodium:solute symporter family protein [Haladaptatus pallidirubidus]
MPLNGWLNWFSIGILVSLLLYTIVGNYAGRLVNDVEDYYVAGRNAPTLLIVGTLVASFLSTVSFLGEVGYSYNGYPVLLLILVAINISGYVIGAYFFGRYIYQLKPLTIPEYFGRRFDSNNVRIAAALTLILGLGVYLVAVSQGISLLIADITGFSYLTSLLLIMVVYVAFTFYSGSQGVIITDTMMFLLFTFAAILAAPFILNAAGGWPEAVHQLSSYSLRPGILSWHGNVTGADAYYSSKWDALAYAVSFGLIWMIVVAVSPWQTSRYIMAKNEQTILRSGVATMVIIGAIYAILHLSVSAISLINPDISPAETVFVWAAQNILPTWLGVIVLSGIVAAGMSSCSTFLSLVGFSLSHDLFEISGISILERYETDEEYLRLSRFFMLAFAVVVFAVTYFQPPAVLWIGYFAASIFAAAWGPIAFASVHWSRTSKTGALWGIILGFVTIISAKVLAEYGSLSLPTYLPPEILGFLVSLVAVIAGSYINGPTQIERERRKEMVNNVGTATPQQIRTTLNYTRIAILSGVLLSGGLLFFYYLPYTG